MPEDLPEFGLLGYQEMRLAINFFMVKKWITPEVAIELTDHVNECEQQGKDLRERSNHLP